MKEEASRSQNSSLVPFLFGGMIGVLAGLLFAPKAGSETRKQIKNFAVDAQDRISTAVGKSLDMYDNAKIAITSAVEAGKQAYFQEREKYQTLQ